MYIYICIEALAIASNYVLPSHSLLRAGKTREGSSTQHTPSEAQLYSRLLARWKYRGIVGVRVEEQSPLNPKPLKPQTLNPKRQGTWELGGQDSSFRISGPVTGIALGMTTGTLVPKDPKLTDYQ